MNIGPYTYVSRNEQKTFKNGRSFRIIIYGAYNAYGLIGSERNGIAVLDEDKERVVLDDHERQLSGYYGPSADQQAEFERILGMSWREFRNFVNDHPRSRFEYDPQGEIAAFHSGPRVHANTGR